MEPAEPERGNRRLWVALAIVLALVLVGGGVYIVGNGRSPSDGAQGPGGATTTGTDPTAGDEGTDGGGEENPGQDPGSGAAPEAMAACGDVYCPSEPLCFNGFVSHNGRADPPERKDCAEPHYWEVFLAKRVPDSAVQGRQDELIERPEFAQLCDADRLASMSRTPADTAEWNRDAWPAKGSDDAWVVYCVAGQGEQPGTVMRTNGPATS